MEEWRRQAVVREDDDPTVEVCLSMFMCCSVRVRVGACMRQCVRVGVCVYVCMFYSVSVSVVLVITKTILSILAY